MYSQVHHTMSREEKDLWSPTSTVLERTRWEFSERPTIKHDSFILDINIPRTCLPKLDISGTRPEWSQPSLSHSIIIFVLIHILSSLESATQWAVCDEHQLSSMTSNNALTHVLSRHYGVSMEMQMSLDRTSRKTWHSLRYGKRIRFQCLDICKCRM